MGDETNTEATEAPAQKTKSIVPSKYAGRYKNGGNDDLAKFINEVCRVKDGFSYEKFFDLCRKNGLPEDKVAHYEAQVITEKRLGSQGRARMTLRNMLATIARKEGGLKDLDGEEVPIEMPKTVLTGAAASAKAKHESETAPAESTF
jgi:hypothetical protein